MEWDFCELVYIKYRNLTFLKKGDRIETDTEKEQMKRWRKKQ